MEYKLDEDLKIATVELNVVNIEKQKEFYQDTIGLDVLFETKDKIFLGKNEVDLLVLKQTLEKKLAIPTTGLYHIAFLVPERKDLGNILLNFLENDVALIGAANHGYSEALYLEDYEGNGIEIYCDKPRELWDIRDNGEIVGITEPLDAEGVLNSADRSGKGLPIGTIIGHVHLQVSDLEVSSKYYQNILGFSLKYHFGDRADFLAVGEYHHHIGMNTWAGPLIQKLTIGMQGLNKITFELSSEQSFILFEKHLINEKIDFIRKERKILLIDPNNISLEFMY